MGTHLPLVDSSSQNLHSPAVDGASRSGPITRVLPDVLRIFGDESVSEHWRVPQHSPEGIRCPNGDSGRIAERLSRHPTPYRRRDCRTQFSVKSHSAPRASQRPLNVWGQAFHLCSAVSNAALVDKSKVLTVAQKSVRTLACRISEAGAPAQRHSPLGETNEADPTAYESPVRHGTSASSPTLVGKIESGVTVFDTWTILQEVTRV